MRRPTYVFPASFVALQYRNYRLLWIGQLVSIAGNLMQSAAVLWHIKRFYPALPGGALDPRAAIALGLVGLVRIGPIIVFSLVGGVVADSLDRRRLLVITQSIMGLAAVALAVATFNDMRVIWPIYVLTAIGAAAAAFDNPARNALVPSLVPPEHMASAVSLNTMMFQLSAVAGPALGGFVIAYLGLGWVYAINAISFAAVIIAVTRMRDLPAGAGAQGGSISLGAAWEGLQFVFKAPLIRGSMLMDFFATFFASATALLPIFAEDVLHVGVRGYGLLQAAPAAGAFLAAAVMVPAIRRMRRRGWVMLGSVFVYGAATVAFGLSRSFWLTFACLVVYGASDMVSTVIRNVIRQLATPDRLRGRMTSVNMLFFMGGPQLGEMEAGVVASIWGAAASVISGGIACLLATGWVAWSTPELRAYEREAEELVGRV
ncbi:MAG: MFS transporter [Ardenticatenales bacterium]